ncbi:MAG: hypothetical protein QXP53_02740 [Candidatus Pacearchaeota archaeon]
MRPKEKKGQVSVEFALLIGFITFLLIAIIGIAYYYSGTAKTQIKVNAVDKAGKKIADTADSICYLGPPSKATIQLTIPEGVDSVEFPSTQPFGILFKVRIKGTALTDMFYKTQCKLVDEPGIRDSLAKQGVKSLVLQAELQGNNVLVKISKAIS